MRARGGCQWAPSRRGDHKDEIFCFFENVQLESLNSRTKHTRREHTARKVSCARHRYDWSPSLQKQEHTRQVPGGRGENRGALGILTTCSRTSNFKGQGGLSQLQMGFEGVVPEPERGLRNVIVLGLAFMLIFSGACLCCFLLLLPAAAVSCAILCLGLWWWDNPASRLSACRNVGQPSKQARRFRACSWTLSDTRMMDCTGEEVRVAFAQNTAVACGA
jgi:hypothetical protein